MKLHIHCKSVIFSFSVLFSSHLWAQSPSEKDSILLPTGKVPLSSISREDISKMSYQDLVELPFENLLLLSQTLDISIEDLLNTKLSVSSKAVSTVREQPNILTVVTEEQIRASGARDLMGVLRTVPGIFFGNDVIGVMGIGMRGIWAQEGKVLLLIDGQEMNELRYSGIPFFNHYNIDNIKRIEIIRGPGSSVYGGSAELGVINIITKGGSDLNGMQVSVSGSYLTKTVGRKSISLSDGAKTGDLEYSMSLFASEAKKGEGTFESFYFQDEDPDLGLLSVPLESQYGSVQSYSFNSALAYKDLSFRFIYDWYKTYAMDLEIYDNSFSTYLGEVKYNWDLLGSRLKITPKYNFKRSVPWYTEGYGGNESILRQTAGISGIFKVNSKLTVTGGLELFRDHAWLQYPDSVDYYFLKKEDSVITSSNSVFYNNYVCFLESALRFKSVNFTLGGRYQFNDAYGSAFAPRFGFNQVLGNFHYKLLLSKAFRTPDIGNLETGTDIKPEETNVAEFETGYKIRKNMFITANLFDITIEKPIHYYEEGDYWDYRNGEKLGSRGVEVEYMFRHPLLTTVVNYSFYSSRNKSSLESYMSKLNGDAHLGAPQHKASFCGSYRINSNLTLSATVNAFSTTYGYLKTKLVSDSEGSLSSVPQEGYIPPVAIFGTEITYNNFFVKGLTLSTGVSDFTNKKYPFVQPYNGFEAPLSSPGREFYLRINHSLKH